MTYFLLIVIYFKGPTLCKNWLFQCVFVILYLFCSVHCFRTCVLKHTVLETTSILVFALLPLSEITLFLSPYIYRS